MNLFLSILISFFVILANAYPLSVKEIHRVNTDDELRNLAVAKGIIPEAVDETFISEQERKGNTFYLWMIMTREEKTRLIDRFKKFFKEEEGVIIDSSSAHYVDQINKLIFDHLQKYDGYADGSGLKITFSTIAVTEGDFDKGKGKVETLKEYFGEEMFGQYKQNFPDKYQHLVDIDQ